MGVFDSHTPPVPGGARAAAVEALAAPGDRTVLGPSEDGGYYLIGVKAAHRRLFEEIDWSTERVGAQTLARAAEIGVDMIELPTWYDVDDGPTLRALCEELFDPESPRARAGGFPAPKTREFLAAVLDREGRGRIWPETAE